MTVVWFGPSQRHSCLRSFASLDVAGILSARARPVNGGRISLA
jgi:hypothetical protein